MQTSHVLHWKDEGINDYVKLALKWSDIWDRTVMIRLYGGADFMGLRSTFTLLCACAGIFNNLEELGKT